MQQGAHRSCLSTGSRHAQAQNMRLNNTLQVGTLESSAETDTVAAAAAPTSQHQHLRICKTAVVHPLFTASSLVGRLAARSLPPSNPVSAGTYLKLAGDFTWMLRPDGGVAFLFSLSAMLPLSHFSVPPCSCPGKTPERGPAMPR